MNGDVEWLQSAVLGWGATRLRALPWRETRDPWGILVSEVMLQQTGVHRVMPKWHAFMDRFPSPHECADGALGEVLALWQGLGYPRRARNLHLAAGAVVARHAGRIPDELDALLALPGVGPYTARAVLAFAFEHDVAVVDTNIARVLARVHGRRFTARDAQRAADEWLAEGESWAWNQMLMELGATVCRARAPSCDQCPIAPACSWHGVGPDPAEGSAGVSGRQARFEGSDRQARGRLLAALVEGSIGAVEDAAAVMQLSAQPERAARLVAALADEGLVAADPDGRLRLP